MSVESPSGSGAPSNGETDRSAATADTEPAVLGAAATLPDQRRTRRTRRERRAARSHGRQSVPPRSSASRADGATEDDGGVEYVFEANTSLSTPLRPYLRSLWERRTFLLELARADLRGKRSSTALGALWAILDPLLQAGIFFLLFTIIRPGGRPIDFLHVLIGGIFLFTMGLTSITEGGKSIRSSKSLMLNSTFPRALFPIAVVTKGVLTFPPKVLVYILFHIGLQAPVGWGLLLLPLLFALQVVLMVGLALFVSTLVVFFKDVENAVQYIGRLLFFTTPVIYPLSLIPDGVRAFVSWQPFFGLFASYQTVLDGGVPGLGWLLLAALWAIGALLVGTRVFLRHERELAIRL